MGGEVPFLARMDKDKVRVGVDHLCKGTTKFSNLREYYSYFNLNFIVMKNIMGMSNNGGQERGACQGFRRRKEVGRGKGAGTNKVAIVIAALRERAMWWTRILGISRKRGVGRGADKVIVAIVIVVVAFNVKGCVGSSAWDGIEEEAERLPLGVEVIVFYFGLRRT